MPTARKAKITHIDVRDRGINAHSQFCIASSCSNIQMQISADDYSLCSLWSTTRGALDVSLWFWTLVSSSAQLSWMEVISDVLLLCWLSCLACFEGRVAQQTVNEKRLLFRLRRKYPTIVMYYWCQINNLSAINQLGSKAAFSVPGCLETFYEDLRSCICSFDLWVI